MGKLIEKAKKIKYKKIVLKADGKFHELEEEDEIDKVDKF